MMATKSEVFDDSKSVTSPPPHYDDISTSAAYSVKHTGRRLIPSLFSFLQNKQKRRTVLSSIRDIVSAPNFASSSVAPTINACAAAISPAEISDLLQKLNIEGHTAMYWAVVNHRREAFSAFAAFIPKFSFACSSDLRLACMSTGDHALFTQLNLGRVISPQDESLRHFLGCPPDEVQVYDTGDGLDKNQFVACFRIRMFQKRMLMRRKLGVEFVAEGRIWLFEMFPVAPDGKWRIWLSLSQESLPACPKVVLVIKAHSRKPECPTPPQDLRILHDKRKPHDKRSVVLAPVKSATDSVMAFQWKLRDLLVLNKNTMYVDCDGTLHAKMEVSLS